MSGEIRIVSCVVKQHHHNVVYDQTGIAHSVAVGPKQIELSLQTDGPFPTPKADTLEEFLPQLLPHFDKESLRTLITEATAILLQNHEREPTH